MSLIQVALVDTTGKIDVELMQRELGVRRENTAGNGLQKQPIAIARTAS